MSRWQHAQWHGRSPGHFNKSQPFYRGSTVFKRSFWSRRKIDPDFTYSFVDEIVNHWDLDWVMPSLAPKVKKYCEDLGMWNEDESCVNYRWHVEKYGPEEMTFFPKRLPHAGRYEWIGKESNEPPKWLWDSKTGRTVRVTKKILREGYIAVSYTWGRWSETNKWRRIEGVPWEVPAVSSTDGCDPVITLLPILARIPSTRYYWVDVLCINQTDPVERRQEIAKQGSIFSMATSAFVYLWSVPNGHNLALALCHLGDSVLWQIKINPFHQFLTQKFNATYEGRRYSKGPKEDRSPTPFAWALQADPWFTSLWTLQEMVLCPSGVLMARNGEFCTINGQHATVARMATAISLTSEIRDIRKLLPEADSFIPYLRRKLVRVALDKVTQSDNFGPAMDRAMDAISVLRSQRKYEWMLQTRSSIWTDWNSAHSLDISLSADRLAILSAVTKRTATRQRGEAILAAMKVAPFDGAFDKDGVIASGLPRGLLEKILRAEGRLLLLNTDGERAGFSDFFRNITPQDHSISWAAESGSTPYEGLPAQDWSITAEEQLHIPFGSQLQEPDSRKILINVDGTSFGKTIWDMRTAPSTVASAYRKWMRRQSWRESISRAFGLPIIPRDPFDDPETPREIEVRFLPLVVIREPEDTKKIRVEARKDPLQFLLYRFLRLNLGTDDRVGGIILGSDRKAHAGQQKVWYKCGEYISVGEFTPFGVPEKEGILVGKL